MRLKQLHFTSSIGAAGPSGLLTGEDVEEDQRPILDTKRVRQHVGYAQSKLVQENIVWKAIDAGTQSLSTVPDSLWDTAAPACASPKTW